MFRADECGLSGFTATCIGKILSAGILLTVLFLSLVACRAALSLAGAVTRSGHAPHFGFRFIVSISQVFILVCCSIFHSYERIFEVSWSINEPL